MKIFKPGDEVIALTDPHCSFCQPRKKGKRYVVEAIMYCIKCGQQFISLSNKSNNKSFKCACGNIKPSQGLYWTPSDHFSKSDDFQEALQEAIDNEDYEMASLLRDLKLKLQSNVKN
jgi:hypothetical protein